MALGCAFSILSQSAVFAGDVPASPDQPVPVKQVTPTAGTAGNSSPAIQATTQSTANPAVQLVKERYPNRSIKIERHVTQDDTFNFVNHGGWTMWSPGGSIVAKGDYVHGKRQGEWIRWFAQSEVAASVDKEEAERQSDEFADKKIDPLAGTEFEGFKPPIASRAKFVDDLITGAWTVTDSDDRNLFQVHLVKNVPHGKATWWSATGGKIREIDFKNGVVDGQWQEWNAESVSTRDDRYIDGCRLAEVTLTNDAGSKTAEGVYLYAKENVKVELDWWSGLMEVSSSLGEGKALKQGKWQFYHDDGSKRYEAEYVDDKPVGMHVWWYVNGQKECEGRYEDGKPAGVWNYWHANGIQAAQGEYQTGSKVGRWLRWNEDGKVTENKNYLTKNSAPVIRPAVPAPAPVARPAAKPIRNASLPTPAPAPVQATPAKSAAPVLTPPLPPSASNSPNSRGTIRPVSATTLASAKSNCRECNAMR